MRRISAHALATLAVGLWGWSVTAQAQDPPPTDPVTDTTPPLVASTPDASGEWLSELYHQTRGSVVLIRTDDGGVGSGFIFHSPRHVATAFHVVANAETIGVTVPGFRPMRAEVIAWDAVTDLAILELPGEIPDARVLEARAAGPHIGMPVAVIGHPFSQYAQRLDELHGLLDWTLTSGIVGGMSEGWIQIDAAVNPGNSGGPVLAEDGTVIGVVSARLNRAEGIGFASRVGALSALMERAPMAPPGTSVIEQDKFELGFMVGWDQSTLTGFMLGGGAVFFQSFPLRLRLGLLNGNETMTGSEVIQRHIDRYAIEVEAGYRLPFFVGMSVSVLLGAAIDVDLIEDTRAVAVDDGSCTPTAAAPCTTPVAITVQKETRVGARPQLGLSATVFFFRLSYAFQADLEQFDHSVHRFYVAVAL